MSTDRAGETTASGQFECWAQGRRSDGRRSGTSDHIILEDVLLPGGDEDGLAGVQTEFLHGIEAEFGVDGLAVVAALQFHANESRFSQYGLNVAAV